MDYWPVDPKHIRKEREEGRKLRASQWWKRQLGAGICHYCGKKFSARALTMDHKVPLARGGFSRKSNVVPACKPCNTEKKTQTPVELILQQDQSP